MYWLRAAAVRDYCWDFPNALRLSLLTSSAVSNRKCCINHVSWFVNNFQIQFILHELSGIMEKADSQIVRTSLKRIYIHEMLLRCTVRVTMMSFVVKATREHPKSTQNDIANHWGAYSLLIMWLKLYLVWCSAISFWTFSFYVAGWLASSRLEGTMRKSFLWWVCRAMMATETLPWGHEEHFLSKDLKIIQRHH